MLVHDASDVLLEVNPLTSKPENVQLDFFTYVGSERVRKCSVSRGA